MTNYNFSVGNQAISGFTAISLILLLSINVAVQGQEVNRFFDRYTTADGLSGNQVLALEQDKHGFLWIGTNAGLNRFDGERFEKFFFNADDSLSLPGNVISALLIDNSDRLWIGTYGDGIALRDRNTGKFKRYRLPSAGYSERSSNKVEALYQLDNTILVSTFSGAFYYDPQNDQFRTINDGFVTHDEIDFGLQLVLTPDTIHKGMWFRCRGDYYFLNEKSHEIYDQKNNPKQWIVFDEYIRSTPVIDPEGKLWYQDWDNDLLKSFSPDDNVIAEYDLPKIRKGDNRYYNTVARILCDQTGKLWIVRNNPVQLCFSPETGLDSALFANDFPGAIGKGVLNTLFTDNQGLLFVGTDNGLYYEKFNTNPTHLHFTGLDDQIRIVTMHNDTVTVLAGKSAVQFNIADPEKRKTISYSESGINTTVVYACEFGKSILFQTQDTRFWTLDPNKWEVTSKSFQFAPEENELSGQNVNLMMPDGEFIWASVVPFGIYRENLSNGEVIHWSPDEEGIYNLPAGHINSITIDEKGEILIALGGGKGVYILNKNTLEFKPYLVPGTVVDGVVFPDANVLCMYRHTDGRVFLSVDGKGLFVYDGKKLSRYDRFNGLPVETIHQMLSADDKRLILFTSAGLFEMNIANSSFSQINSQAANYNTFVREGGISHGSQSGEILYFYKNVIYRIEPGKESDKKNSTNASIGAFRIFDKQLYTDDIPQSIVLNYDQNFFTISITAFDFHHSTSTELAYKLEGFDKDWIICDHSTEAPYTNVPAGEYNFLIRTRESGSDWSDPVIYSIVIHPPFWETWWFRILIIAIVLGIVYGIYRYRLSQILKLQAVRNKIASDLHDDIGATLSSINIFSKVAGDHLKSKPEETLQLLQRINSSSVKMMDNMSDIVWSINPQNDTLHSLIMRIKAHGAEVLGSMGIKVILENEIPEDVQLNMNARKNIFLIAKECINNIAKHSGASEAKLKFSEDKGHFYLEITDNGHSQENGNKKGGNGLNNMRTRTGELGGRIDIHFNAGGGTTVLVRLPMTNIHH